MSSNCEGIMTAGAHSLQRVLTDPWSIPSMLTSLLPGSVQRPIKEAVRLGRGSLEASKVVSGGETIDKKNTIQLIHEAGYKTEEYKLVTEDGYMLTVQRIVADRIVPNKPVVFLQHGLLCSSSDWVFNGKNESLGFILADAGYDVWLGNFRGNTYSREHLYLDPDKEPFWRFSYDQMGEFDLPAMLVFVLGRTKKEQLIFVGHSMGTMAFWIMMDKKPWMNAKVQLMVGLAPVTTASLHDNNPLRYVVPVADQLSGAMNLVGSYEFGQGESIVNALSGVSTGRGQGSNLVSGGTSGTSYRTLCHFAQGIRTGKFTQWDFPTEDENLEHYGSRRPSQYDLSKVTCPVILYWGENDWLSQPQGVANIAAKLPNLVKSVRVAHDEWNHLDFLWGKDADRLVYSPLVTVMEEFTHKAD